MAKPPNLEKRGGCWFEGGAVRLHLGAETGFRPARKAHVALLIEGLADLVQRLAEAGVVVRPDEPLRVTTGYTSMTPSPTAWNCWN